MMVECNCGHMSGDHQREFESGWMAKKDYWTKDLGCKHCACKVDDAYPHRNEIREQIEAEMHGWTDPDRDKDDW